MLSLSLVFLPIPNIKASTPIGLINNKYVSQTKIFTFMSSTKHVCGVKNTKKPYCKNGLSLNFN